MRPKERQEVLQKLTHRLARYKKVPEGILLELEPTDAARHHDAPRPLGPERKNVLIYKEYVDEGLRAFVENKEMAGLYYGADVTDKTETVYLRYLGHIVWDADIEDWVYHDLCTLSKHGTHLVGSNGIVGVITAL